MRRVHSESEQGGTLVEIMMALTILMVGVAALASTLVGGARLSEESRDSTIVAAAARNVVEHLRSENFASLSQLYGEGSNNSGFIVTGSGDVQFIAPGSEDRIYGTVLIYDDEGSIPATFTVMSGGFDLNANGAIDSGPITDYRVLPITVVLKVVEGEYTRTVSFDRILSKPN